MRKARGRWAPCVPRTSVLPARKASFTVVVGSQQDRPRRRPGRDFIQVTVTCTRRIGPLPTSHHHWQKRLCPLREGAGPHMLLRVQATGPALLPAAGAAVRRDMLASTARSDLLYARWYCQKAHGVPPPVNYSKPIDCMPMYEAQTNTNFGTAPLSRSSDRRRCARCWCFAPLPALLLVLFAESSARRRL